MSSRHLNVSQFLLYETAGYTPQYRRPITTQVYGDKLARIQEATQFGSNLSPNALARVASEILLPCTQIEGTGVAIPNGWQSKRYHFILEITTGNTSHGSYRKVLSGFTDISDLSYGGHLPPDMILQINGHLTLRDIKIPGPHGIQVQTTVVNNDQILVGQYHQQGFSNNDHTIRPYDVVRKLGTDKMMAAEDDGSVNFDLTTTFATGVKNNARKNTNPSTYISRLMSACVDADRSKDNQFLDDSVAVFDNAAGRLTETLISDDAVFSAFNRVSDFARTGFITMLHLESLCPGVESRAKVHKLGGVHSVRPTIAGTESNQWHGENIETIIAARIAQSLPGILLDNALNKISLVMTNMNVDGSYTVMPIDHTVGSVIKGIDLIQMAQRVLIRVRDELMPGITDNNLIDVYITVDCDTMSDTRINVSVAGRPYEPFVSPTFADSLFSPIVTAEQWRVDKIATDVANLSANIGYQSSVSPQPRIYTGGTTPRGPVGGGDAGGTFGGRFV